MPAVQINLYIFYVYINYTKVVYLKANEATIEE